MPIKIIEEQRRLHESGRIRIGQQVPITSGNNKGKMRPQKLQHFRFTTSHRPFLDRLAALYGGEVKHWDDAPVGEQWELLSEASAIPVLVPPSEFAFSQWYELWSGGGCQRRCDSEWDVINERPCECDPDPEKRECKPHTRLSLLLTDLDSMGIWRLDTQGWYAAVELAGAMEIVHLAAQRGRMLPAQLLLEQRMVKVPGKPPNQFAVPVLDLMVPMAALTADTTHVPGLTAVPTPDALPVASLADQMRAVEQPAGHSPRSNGAEPIRPTGIRPRTVAEVSAPTADDEEDQPPATHMPTKWRNEVTRRLAHAGVTGDEAVGRVVGFATAGRSHVLTGVKPEESESVLEAVNAIESGELVLNDDEVVARERTG